MKYNKTVARMSFLAAFALFSFVAYTPQERSRIPSGELSPDDANAKIDHWYEEKSSSLRDWLTRRGENGGPPDFLDFYLEQEDVRTGATAKEMEVALETKKLYDSILPDAHIGTFFESGHPYIETKRGPYQWDSMWASGMKEPKLFKESIKKLTSLGIKSFRIGPNIHEVSEKPESWDSFVDKLEVIWEHDATPIISVAFFPSLKKWQVKKENGEIDYFNSYLLHKKWPADMGQLTFVMMEKIWERAKKFEKLGKKVTVVVNPVNEPETLAGFNRHFWHGAHANWGSPEKFRFYIPSVIQIAKANVEIRRAVEAASPKKRILFMHNEAMTPDYYPSHTGGGRFAVSKLMLGDDVLMKADLKALYSVDLEALADPSKKNELSWILKEFVHGSWNRSDSEKALARKQILIALTELQNLHRALSLEYGKTMKTDNMLHLDYYYQTEFIPNKKIPDLAKELAADNGKFLAEILGVKSEKELLRFVRDAAGKNEGDLPPEGPKGVKFVVSENPDWEKILSQDDYVLIERLIGLRRDISFKNQEPYKSRQKILGVDKHEGQFYRLDVYLDKLLANDGKLLKEFTGKSYTREELDADGRKLFHEIIGADREILIGFEPQHYARQIKAGIRYGFYSIFMEYVKTLRIYTVGVGESGTPFYIFAPLLHDQVMMEYARALRNGLYGTQYSFGPAVDTRGWAKAPLGLHYEDDHDVNPSGLLMIKQEKDGSRSLKFRGDENSGSEWAKIFVNPLLEKLK